MKNGWNDTRGVVRVELPWFSAMLVLELALGYGVFLLYPGIASMIFGGSAVYAHANTIVRALSPTIILLFNIVIFISNMDTPQKGKLEKVNRSLRLLSIIYSVCYLVFLVSCILFGPVA